jgi:hypothetical protein
LARGFRRLSAKFDDILPCNTAMAAERFKKIDADLSLVMIYLALMAQLLQRE